MSNIDLYSGIIDHYGWILHDRPVFDSIPHSHMFPGIQKGVTCTWALLRRCQGKLKKNLTFGIS